MNKTIDIYSIRIYKIGTIILCDKNIFRICMFFFSKPPKFSTIRESNTWLGLWGYKKHLYMLSRRRSFRGEGSGN